MNTSRTRRGKLIVFEGPDGVGKTTISGEVFKRLSVMQIDCELMSFPGSQSGTVGSLVYDVHHAPSKFGIENLSPSCRQALHIIAHLDAIERRIIPAIKAGRHILLDRFWWSTWVYGITAGIKRQLLKSMIDLELAAWEEIKPSAAILLRRDTPIERDDQIGYWRKLARGYDVLARREQHKYPVFTVNNTGALQDTLNQISEILDTKSRVRRVHKATRTSLNETQLPIEFEMPQPQPPKAPQVLTHLLPAKPTVVFDTFWRFAAERQEIFFRRLEGSPAPWTSDRILNTHKFTNVYRASDRVSQYLIRHVIYRDDLAKSVNEVFFRIILFKLFNKIETWQLLEQNLGPISYETFSFKHYDRILTNALQAKQTIYSAAYIMPSGGKVFGHTKKHRNNLRLLEKMMKDQLPAKIADAKSMQSAFSLLRDYPTIGDFLAYQFVTDLNYSEMTSFNEMDFVVPGPGALDGIRKCFLDLGGLNEAEIIRFMADIQEAEFSRLGLQFRSLWGRRLQLIDCQNLFCEVDKYARVAHPEINGVSGRTRIKQKFFPRSISIVCWYPPKWGINNDIKAANHNFQIKG